MLLDKLVVDKCNKSKISKFAFIAKFSMDFHPFTSILQNMFWQFSVNQKSAVRQQF